MTFPDVPAMHFGAGWILTFAAVFFLNGFLLFHWLLTDFRSRRTAKALACALVNAALAAPFFVYFVRFFGGMSYEPYMVPLGYAAGFYLCFSIYAAGVFFVTDIFRGARKAWGVIRRLRAGRETRSGDGESRAAVDGRGTEAEGVDGACEAAGDGLGLEAEGVDRACEAAGDGRGPEAEGMDGACEAAGDGRGPEAERASDVAGTANNGGLPRLIKPRFALGVAIVCAVCALAAFYTPTRITATEYDVELDRGDSGLTRVRAAFISDTHVGPAVRERELDRIVAMTNEMKPDIVLLGGDIIDEGTPEYLRRYVTECFSGFESVYGTYYILGNHDDYRGDTEAALSVFKDAGIRCLLDETVLVDGEFYLIGREDNPLRRRPLSELEAQVTENLPVIVLDHRPRVGESGQSDAVDLQLSGHTHDGQIFPFHLLDPLGLFSLNYGRYDRNEMQIIVSSGAGEYAVPVRLGSPAEILVVDLSLR